MHTKIGEIMMNVLNVNKIKKEFLQGVTVSVTRPIQMIIRFTSHCIETISFNFTWTSLCPNPLITLTLVT